ncbi:hypothetical protein WBG78_11545 [Chryseolinea sp. T2]|uniref:hypothetical protein n=1 Tax=Chryseolinea sp. T2 TaxID=3129255 RepID=UPI003077E4E5
MSEVLRVRNLLMRSLPVIFFLLSGIALTHAQVEPISLHPDNPHYFKYHNNPLILISSGEHYGSVLNLDFNFTKYLNELSARKLNLTRTFTGAYIEPIGAFNIENNMLAPASGRYISPWKRSSVPGFQGGGNKFDLTAWDEAYFDRLKRFVREAEQRNIIVELTLFCPFYEMKQWVLSPMHPSNNVNNVPFVGKDSVYTMDHSGPLLQIQEQLVAKLVSELNGFSNIIFEICNEPYFGGVTIEWQHHIATLIGETEKGLPWKHLISQNIANDSALISNPHPGVSVFNFHYATPPTAVKQNYHLNKVIGDNETGFRGQADSTYRKEGWEIILAGGALYNNLDYSFAPGYEDGTLKYHTQQPGGGSTALRNQLTQLKQFIEHFNYLLMSPDKDFRITAEQKPRIHMLSEPGRQYAAYIVRGGRATVAIPLPAGRYEVRWIDPATGKIVAEKNITQNGKKQSKSYFSLQSPAYAFDIALSIARKQ